MGNSQSKVRRRGEEGKKILLVYSVSHVGINVGITETVKQPLLYHYLFSFPYTPEKRVGIAATSLILQLICKLKVPVPTINNLTLMVEMYGHEGWLAKTLSVLSVA